MLSFRIKAFTIITKVLIVHHSYYHWYRKKEQPNSSVPRDSKLSRLYRGVQLYPHGRTRLTTIPLRESKGCLTSSNLSLTWSKCPTKRSDWVPNQCPGYSRLMPSPLPISQINRSQLVTWLVNPICYMWSVRVVTRTYVSQYYVV
jgi:hypothetical protein